MACYSPVAGLALRCATGGGPANAGVLSPALARRPVGRDQARMVQPGCAWASSLLSYDAAGLCRPKMPSLM